MITKINKIICAGLISCGIAAALTACSDTWDDHYEGTAQGVQEGSLWQAIKQNSSLSNFASVIEACGYDKSLDGSQVFTVFAPTNDHFSSSEAAELIQTYNQEKGKVSDEDNTVIKEFLQNHIALFNHSVSSASNDSLVLMNGKRITLTSGAIGSTPLSSSNQLYQNGVLFTVNGKVTYQPSVFEYLRKDADLDSVRSFFYNERFYRKEFLPERSVAGGFVDGKTVYLDSVFRQQNDLFDYNFLGADLNEEDSVYWMVVPTNEVWSQLIDEYSQYFNYDNQVFNRDSMIYTNPRMAIARGTVFSRSYNQDAALGDSALSTNAYTTSSSRDYYWGRTFLHYYQYGDGTGFNQLKPYEPGGVFYNAQTTECSNGKVLKTNQWNFNPLNTFYQWIIVEAEDQGSIQEVSKVENTSTGEMEETVTPKTCYVDGYNKFYGKLGGNSFIEFEPTRTTVNHTVTFNIKNVLSNIGYDIYLVSAPALANDSNATDNQRLPTKVRCYLSYHDQSGATKTETIQSGMATTPDVVDYMLLAEDFKFPCSSFGLEEENPQVTLKVETRVTSTEQRTNKFSRTMRIDCIMLVPHGQAVVTNENPEDHPGLPVNSFIIAPHGDGVAYAIPRK